MDEFAPKGWIADCLFRRQTNPLRADDVELKATGTRVTPRNTSTGAVLEAMIVPALVRGGYTCERQVRVGKRCGGRVHKVDAVATKNDERLLVSLKWQQTAGTAEQKVPFEVMCLAEAIRGEHAARAYLVLGGDRWTLRDYFTSGALSEHLIHAALVRVVTLESFVRLANGGQL